MTDHIDRAQILLNFLRQKHDADVFVPECKDGPTHYTNYLRMDAWVMTRSWANPMSIVYEIKCSRNDFLNDQKWRNYLHYCNEFYFVTPKGTIQPNELPAEVGLLEGTTNLKRLICRKRAVYRDLEVPESVYRYILMCRARIVSEYNPDMTREERLAMYVKRLDSPFKLTGLKIARQIREYIEKIESENANLVNQHKDYDDIRGFLTSIGLTPDMRISRWTVERAIKGEDRDRFIRELKEVIDRSQNIIDRLQQRELFGETP
jgi:hypothetical protein